MNNRQLFLKHVAQTSDAPLMLEIEKAEGMYMYTSEGKKIMDLISGISVSNVGHRHPKVVNAIKNQLDKYMHLMVYGEFIQSPQTELAQSICKLLPANLSSVYFTNSGSEANEGALKLAKRYTGRREIIAFKNAYHGSTQGVLSIIGGEYFKQGYEPLLPETKNIHFNSFEDLNVITSKTACVIVEPVQAEAGVISPTNGYLEALRKRCNETRTLLIFDEIQTGFGRTGELFAFQKFGVIPDILTIAKGMGGGMPIGAFIASKEIMQTLTHNPVLGHITTFGGHPVCCAASKACLDVIVENQLYKYVKEKEERFLKQLKHRLIKEVRSNGLLIAVQFENYEFNKKVIDTCIENGLLTDWFLFNDSSMRIAPPLIITNEEIDWACEIILKSISTCSK
jgi:acetylornithine/succinyldiaminopimelate/putrescine aminotransferase